VVENLNLSFGPHLAFLQPELANLKRFGVPRDGGYVGPPESIANNSVIFCFGLSRDWSFETELSAQVKGARIFAFDPTVNLKMFAAECFATLKQVFNFKSDESLNRRARVFGYRSKIVKNYLISFRLQRNKHIKKWIKDKSSEIENCISIGEIFTKYGKNCEVVLKIDIEGDEFEVLNELLTLGQMSAIRSLFIEFHVFDSNWQNFSDLVHKLKETHSLVHLHVNNGDLTLIQQATPHYLELTFIRKGILPETKELRKLLPIAGIDFSNQIGLPDFDIQFT
jgi:hypothetical protein